MAIYLKKLAPHGIVVMHISNRHLELASVVAGIAAANGMVTRVNDSADVVEDDANTSSSARSRRSARADEDFGAARASRNTGSCRSPIPRQWVWTDDYSNIVGAVIRKYRE